MLNETVIQGAKKCIIKINASYERISNSTYLFGFPIFNNSKSLDPNKIDRWINTINGYFLYINIGQDYLTIATDTLGGFRLYYYENEQEIYFLVEYCLYN